MENIKLDKEDSETIVKALVKGLEDLSESTTIASESFNKFTIAAKQHKDLIQSEEDWF
ncbi:hypothetical protein AXI64_gp116 [Vibrio phage qdvp001]|uniref:hypothetical protein n=1 Tax=Vibrio phage qdvp001 TaxID=1003177 RepID=UPI00071FCB65|nr:hypothetical protein AXI64_gp116 [Vibrio phage qdvp001]ALM62108.1 hypothetical protein qdvp001_116 [Vibrio phage qdvp001]